jgi:transcriptional regulator with XRE-family HTH domain
MSTPFTIQIRNKKLGLLILDARNHEHRSIEECAAVMQASVEQFQAYESGEQAPSLPQLELLSAYLHLPLDHFWSNTVIAVPEAVETLQEKERLLQIRNRIIGATLKMGRSQANVEMAEICEKTGLNEEQLDAYENGSEASPLPVLEILAALYRQPLSQYFDQHGPIGKQRHQNELSQKFSELSPEMQQFITNPLNQPYLDLATRLSELPADKLRTIAEALLEITI